MRYFVRDGTLFIRGRFRAASTGVKGGIADVTTILNHTVPHDFQEDPVRRLELITAWHGVFRDYFGLLTAVDMRHLCVLQYTVTAYHRRREQSNPSPSTPHTIHHRLQP